jgi:hypothetical protein
MQESWAIKGAAAAWISNYYLSQDVQYVFSIGSESSMSTSSSGVMLLYSVSVSLLRRCFALREADHWPVTGAEVK